MSRATYEPPGDLSPQRAVLATGNIASDLPRPGTSVPSRAWRGGYVRRLVAADVGSALLAAAGGLAVPGAPPDGVLLALPVVWVVALFVARCYDQNVLYEGPDEYRRVLAAAGLVLAGVALFSWGSQQDVPRGFVAVTLSVAAVLTLAERSMQRRMLFRARRQDRCTQTTLLVGHGSGIALLHRQFQRQPQLGYRVVGCCLPPSKGAGALSPSMPILGSTNDVVDVVRQYDVDTVAVLPSAELHGSELRRLGWELEKTRAELLVAPAGHEFAGPRVRIRPVCGLPLLHLARPELRGARRLTKAVFDRVGAVLLLAVVAPVLIAITVVVKAGSRGPALFRQERVGREGRAFPMLKFRTMEIDADRQVPELVETSDGNGVLFKLRRDPRVTPVGRFLRRYSLDELPQLINVLRGEMSLVGPRPPLPVEVQHYGVDMHRRFVVKPGLTGLWQVSGRSDLSWEESVRVDLYYVENWSLLLDLVILWRTFGAVIRGRGAY